MSKWRPSRTLRGLLAVNKPPSEANARAALTELVELQKTRSRLVKRAFKAELALVAGLSGPWTLDGPPDYRSVALPLGVEASIAARNGKTSVDFGGWKNEATTLFADVRWQILGWRKGD